MESLVIYRTAVNQWHIVVDGDDEHPIQWNLYGGGVEGSFLTITTINGTPLINNVPWNVVDYIDEYGSATYTPTTPLALQQFLQSQGFFFAGGSGSSSTTAFTDLEDTFPSYFGLDGQVLYVDGNGIKSRPGGDVTNIQDTQNYSGQFFAPGMYFTTLTATNEDGTSVGWGLSPIGQVINTPIPYYKFRVTAKGQDPSTGTPNEEPFIQEVGDFCEGCFNGYHLEGIYQGGDVNDVDNYIITKKTKIIN